MILQSVEHLPGLATTDFLDPPKDENMENEKETDAM